ncbi:hypothetical protein [Polaromonas sp.]|uniref:hypothetical protein n=1 Tax=Polaromonas sp. TaxID=1869339 RepID=UPI00356156C8
MRKQKLMWVAWPAFLTACGLELLVFALIDPQDLHWSGQPLGWSRQAVYTAAFFAFWGICMVSSMLTVMLSSSSAELNQSGLSRDSRGDVSPP